MKKNLLVVILYILLQKGLMASDTKVIDGDTIRWNGLKIRFSGIDAPETSFKGKQQKCNKNNKIIYCGRLSKEFLVKTIGNNEVKCNLEKRGDQFKRKLGECFIGTESLSKILVKNGYAFDWPKYSNYKFASEQEYAKKNKLGLWGMNFQFPWDFRNQNR